MEWTYQIKLNTEYRYFDTIGLIDSLNWKRVFLAQWIEVGKKIRKKMVISNVRMKVWDMHAY